MCTEPAHLRAISGTLEPLMVLLWDSSPDQETGLCSKWDIVCILTLWVNENKLNSEYKKHRQDVGPRLGGWYLWVRQQE